MRCLTSFGQFSACTNQLFFSSMMLVLRIMLGVQLFWAGFVKLDGWSALSYLEEANGPFADLFHELAGNPWIDFLNIWGLMFLGLALILGIFIRPASMIGILLMGLYYISHFAENTEYGWIDYHIIYIVIFFLFLSGGIGHIFGIDGLITQNTRKKSWWQVVFFG